METDSGTPQERCEDKGPYSEEVSLPAGRRREGGLSAEAAGGGLSVCRPPERRRPCWAEGRPASWWRPCCREEERVCGGQRLGRRARRRRMGEGMKMRRTGGGSSCCWMEILNSLLRKRIKNLNLKNGSGQKSKLPGQK